MRRAPGAVVVTGASGGLGRAIAVEFARHGWRVGLVARGSEGLEGARQEVQAAGGQPLMLPADVADSEAVQAVADQAARAWGEIDVWVNCAMATVFSPVREMSPAEYRRVTEVTYLGYVHGTLAALKHMRPRNAGSIVQVGSALAYRAIPWQSAYCASKFAIRGFTDSLRSELIHEGSRVRLSMVQCPGMNTPQFEWARNHFPKKPQPVAPIYQPEVAARAVFEEAQRGPRELWVGRSTLQAIVGDMLAPGILDRLLARLATDGQLSKESDRPDRNDNLFAPVEGDFGAHGWFDRRAQGTGLVLDPARARIGLAVAGTAAVIGAGLWALFSGRRRGGVPSLGPHLPVRGESSRLPPPIPYPAIEHLGVIGDRRTAAMVAADGTLNWLCLPNYDGRSLFGSLIDHERGGFWRMGPLSPRPGNQGYRDDTPILVTRWEDAEGVLELTDAMLWPETERSSEREHGRVLVRRLRCCDGHVAAGFELRPRSDFGPPPEVKQVSGGHAIEGGGLRLGFWTSCPLEVAEGSVRGRLRLEEDDEVWAVLALDESPSRWSLGRAQGALAATERYWRGWTDRLTYTGPRGTHVRRSAINFHLLSFAPTGALVAAPTTFLPERLGGDRNYDYRFAWIRDVSLSLAILSMLGDLTAAERYMDWLAKLESSTEMPLQVLYRIDGGTDATQRKRHDLAGYHRSTPVLIGNHAFQQRQFDSFGYLADCAHVYLQQGGKWKDDYWALIRRLADYTAENWREPDNGIWELGEQHHHVSSKVMSWVTLERATRIASELEVDQDAIDRWGDVMSDIHAEVMERGWSERRQAFRQHYDSDALDASVLLIPVMEFLPAEHPRVLATIDRIATELTIDGLVYRFDPTEMPGADGVLGEFEGAFLPCTFWLAAALAMTGREDEADVILARVEEIARPLGLFAEEADPRTGTFLGNTPLLFSHAEYVKAVLSLAKARPFQSARLMTGMAARRVKHWVTGD